jgi:polar amino acid transport system substrate-binding protein
VKKRFFLLFLIIFSISNSYANTKKIEYTVGVEDYVRYPFQTVENGKYYGVYRDILDKFAETEGIKFIYKPYKVKELYKNFYEKKFDFKFPDNPVWRAPQKEKYPIVYSNFLTHYIDAIFVRKTDAKKVINELKTFGIVDDIVLWVLKTKSERGKVELKKANSCAELIVKLKRGDVNGIFCNYDVMKYLLNNSAVKDDIIINLDLPFIDNYFYLSTIMYPEIIDKFNIWISNNREFIDRKLHEFK